MLSKELITAVAQSSSITKKRAEELVNATSQAIVEALCAGTSVQLQGLGSLDVKTTNERTIVHPSTGERCLVPSKKQISFHPTANIKDELKSI